MRRQRQFRTSVSQFAPSQLLTNKRNGTTYRRLHLIGRGASSKCFAVLPLLASSRTVRLRQLACKAVPKSLLAERPEAAARLACEIRLHSSLPRHQRVLRLLDWFEDSAGVYLLTRLCSRHTVQDVVSLRGSLTEPETQFYLRQLFDGCRHLHDRCGIAHRDLKPSNLLLTDRMRLLIADFGFACRPDNEADCRIVCGTLAYMAPEVLPNGCGYAHGNGDSGRLFAADIWSIGCVMYTLITGDVPFRGSDAMETCSLIRAGDLSLQLLNLSPLAGRFISRLLSVSPTARPSAADVASFVDADAAAYLRNCLPLLRCLPASALSCPPLFAASSRSFGFGCADDFDVSVAGCRALSRLLQNLLDAADAADLEAKSDARTAPDLDSLIDPRPLPPPVWVSRWVNCVSAGIGLGYQLPDGSVGAVFNDGCRALQSPTASANFYGPNCDRKRRRKLRLLGLFRNYLEHNLASAAEAIRLEKLDDDVKEADEVDEVDDEATLPRPTMVTSWLRSRRSMTFCMSDGVLQINDLSEHTKLILCPQSETVCLIQPPGSPPPLVRTLLIRELKLTGCCERPDSFDYRLRCLLARAEETARIMTSRMLANRRSGFNRER